MNAMPPPPAALLDGAALFLDFDGTLIEFAERPDDIVVPPRLGAMLAGLRERLGGRLAIVSGRSLADLERYVPASGIAFCGSHGIEVKRADGTRLPLDLTGDPGPLWAETRAFAAAHLGLLVEEKPAGVALHFRQLPEAATDVAAFMTGLAARRHLVVQHGKMVVELRPAGADKGDAVRAFMTEPPFIGAVPLFVGDDLTDEHAFAAAAELGGAGILVGPVRESAARYRLPSVASVAEWLETD